MLDTVVIGAGIAGATVARELVRFGVSTCVVEARDRLGGRIQTVRDFCGQPVEAGAEFIHGIRASTWLDARAAGLTMRPSPHTRDTMFNIGHGTHWLPLVLLHPGVWPAFTILRRLERLQPPDMSAREFIERRGYRGRARILAQMVLTAHLPGSIDEVGVLGLKADGVLTLETGLNHRLNQGYDRVVEHIARQVNVQYDFTVDTIEWSPSGVLVRSDDGDERTARTAVCTLPAGVLQSGRVRFVPELPERKRAALQAMVMGPVVKVLLLFQEPFWPRRLATLGCGVGPVTLYWNVFYQSRLPPEEIPAVLTAYCTGPRATALSRVSEEEAVDIVLKDLRVHFPRAKPKLLKYRRIDWGSDPLACGGYTFLRPGGVGARAHLAAVDTGALFWAGSETATHAIAATAEGAYTSGQRAAFEVRRFLESRA